jgi:hypothetical protein
VAEAYQRYLDAFKDISELRIVGGYRYSYEDDAQQERTAVFMIGVTRTAPRVHYYRLGALDANEQIDWEPWKKVGITIDSDRVQPVYAFNRLFIFWLEVKPYNGAEYSSSGTYEASSPEVQRAKLTVKYSFYNFNEEWVAPQAVRAEPDNATDPEAYSVVFSAEAAKQMVVSARNAPKLADSEQPVDPSKPRDESHEYIDLKLHLSVLEWDVGKLSAGLDLKREQYFLPFFGFSLFDPTVQFPEQTGIERSELDAIVPWGAAVKRDTGEWLSFDAKGGTFLCRPVQLAPPAPKTIRGRQFETVSAAFRTRTADELNIHPDIFVFRLDTSTGRTQPLCYHHYVGGQNVWRGPIFVDDPEWPWGRPPGVFQKDPAQRIVNVILAQDGTTYFLLGSQHFTYPSSGYAAIQQPYVGALPAGVPALGALIGGSTPQLSWPDATAAGRMLVNAFKPPANPGHALVLTQANGVLGAVTMSLAALQQASKGSDGKSPFDGWNRLDTVFQVSQPEPRVVFSRGSNLVILTWSSKTWTKEQLGNLPGSGLSAAFTGKNQQLYFFCEDQYAEVNPENLSGNQVFVPVLNRWGRPSLFSWLLTSVDGALLTPGGELHLFCGEWCLRYGAFNPGALAGLVIDTAEQNPPRVPEVWSSTLDQKPAIEFVTAAFERNGHAYLLGHSGGKAAAASYSQLAQPPFAPDPNYPVPLPNVPQDFPTDFYASVLASGVRYAITRLTSHTVQQFSQRLFAGGIRKLLSLETQELDELPSFRQKSDPPAGSNEILFDPHFVSEYPGKGSSGGLDFASSNGFYYREIFFHIPFVIAQALQQAQRFAEAKTWYEYVFDPTSKTGDYWQFIEFLSDDELTPLEPQIKAYRDDPFDPHRIAGLRPIAYRKAFVMSYLDNLLEWGDLLFRQYTRETIGEATMLYVLAADLLGKQPEAVGKRALELADGLTYSQVWDELTQKRNDEILRLENGVPPVQGNPSITTPNDSIFNRYFYIPENEQFTKYWDQVGDRLTKIRNGLNIDGVRQSLALFAPSVDVLALVQAFAAGGSIAQALADYNTPVPHYRFSYVLAKARELTGRLTQLGGSLLAALEKKDAEELSLLRNTQERGILELTLQMKQAQLESVQESLAALQEGLENARTRATHYQRLLADGLSTYEQQQIQMMTAGQLFSQCSNILSIASSIGSFVPQVGSPFAMTYGGQQIGAGLAGLSQSFKALSEAFSFQSSLASTLGGWQRRSQDWELQKALATGDTKQIGRQIKGAEIQVEVARQDVEVQRRQIKNNLSVDTFMRSKFTSQQLYQWMVGKLSATYFQTYHLALQYAKASQRAMQFELGLPEEQVQYIGVGYWDSLKKGLLAGEQLQLDIDRLERAHLEVNRRRFEISRYVSLMQVDSLALVQLRQKGVCEFDLSEALFDGDFPGHYCRQIKSISVSFPAVVGPYDNFNATLTQLTHRTLLSPDKAALKGLLGLEQQNGSAGTEVEPAVLRVDWRPNQQVALSRGTNDSGLFQLNFQDERYLPFEGTGAVSTWRLEINGGEGHFHRDSLSDVIITLQYTALSGGDAFTEAVKNLVGGKARQRACLLNLAQDFADEWHAFLSKPAEGMRFAVERRRLPGASEKKVTGVYLHYDLAKDAVDDFSRQAISLNGTVLKPSSSKTGLNLPLVERAEDGTQDTNRWRLEPVGAAGVKKFTAQNLRNIALVVTYASKATF